MLFVSEFASETAQFFFCSATLAGLMDPATCHVEKHARKGSLRNFHCFLCVRGLDVRNEIGNEISKTVGGSWELTQGCWWLAASLAQITLFATGTDQAS